MHPDKNPLFTYEKHWYSYPVWLMRNIGYYFGHKPFIPKSEIGIKKVNLDIVGLDFYYKPIRFGKSKKSTIKYFRKNFGIDLK